MQFLQLPIEDEAERLLYGALTAFGTTDLNVPVDVAGFLVVVDADRRGNCLDEL